jgi:hypothetical protein
MIGQIVSEPSRIVTIGFLNEGRLSTMKVTVVSPRRCAGGMAPGHSGPVAAAGGQGPYRFEVIP